MPKEFRRSINRPLVSARFVRILFVAAIIFGCAACLSNYFTGGTTFAPVALAQDDAAVEGEENADPTDAETGAGGDAGDATEAGDTEEGGAAQPDRPQQTYLGYLVKSLGKFFAPVFLILSIWAVASCVLNILGIRRSVLMPQELIDNFSTLLDEKKYQEAYELAKESDSFLGKVLAAGLAKIGSGYESAQEAMQNVGEEEVMRIEHRLSQIALLANVAPMIGLLGTVVGMVGAFQTIAMSQTAPQPSKLAEDISMALVTTEFGLFIAIPCIMVYDTLKNMLARMILEVSVLTENQMSRFKTAEPEKK